MSVRVCGRGYQFRYNYVCPSVDRRREHVGLPLSDQCICLSPAVSIVQAERRAPQQTRDVDPMLG